MIISPNAIKQEVQGSAFKAVSPPQAPKQGVPQPVQQQRTYSNGQQLPQRPGVSIIKLFSLLLKTGESKLKFKPLAVFFC